MYLKHLILTGFKSFADRTKLDFSEGITAVVGPNGCGKSNIADAFRWVLGEQSAKSMRGPKMTDVIFAGTSSRKPALQTEVIIELGGIEGYLPILGMDLSITRRLYQNGDGEYLINDQKATLKQIRELLIDSGVGKDSFAIFEQGKINEVIELSPTDRRPIFEEAAGVLGIRKKKKEALKKLELADQNVLRMGDVVKEVESQVIELEGQSKKAILFKENRHQLEDLEKAILFLKWGAIDKKCKEISEKKQKAALSFEEASQKQHEISEELIQSKKQFNLAQEAYFQKKDALNNAKNQKELCLQNHQNQSERLKELAQKKEKWRLELETLKKSQFTREDEVKKLSQTVEALEKEFAEAEKKLQGQQIAASNQEGFLSKVRERSQSAQKRLLDLTRQEKQREGELKQNQIRLQNLEERILLLKEQKLRVQTHFNECQRQAKEKETELKKLSDEMLEAKASLLELEKKVQESIKQEQASAVKKDEANRRFVAVSARLQVLKKLKDERAEFSQGAKRLLKESDTKGSAIFGHLKSLLDCFSPQKEAEKALLIALRPYKETLVTATKDELLNVLKFASEKNIHDFSILCLELVRANEARLSLHPEAGLKDVLSLVETSNSHKAMLDKIAIADLPFDLTTFDQLPDGVALFLNDGVFYDREKVFFIASKGESVSENNAFTREAEIKALEKESSELELLLSSLAKEIADCQKAKAEMSADKQEKDKSYRRQEMKHVEISFALNRLKEDCTKLQAENERAALDEQKIQSQIKELIEAIQTQNQDLQSSKTSSQEIALDSETLLKQVDEHAELHKKEQEALRVAFDHFHKSQGALKKEISTQKLLEMQQNEASKQKNKLDDEIAQVLEQEELLIKKNGALTLDLKAFDETLKVYSEDLKNLDQESQKKKQQLDKVEVRLQKEGALQKSHELELVQLNSSLVQLNTSKESLESDASERHSLSISEIELLPQHQELTLDAAERKVKELRHKIEEMGDVNMTSVDEWQKQKDRLSQLNNQMGEVADVKNELLMIIKALDDESSVKFFQAFGLINENFKKNFALLFEGGEAELALTDPQDIFESGIEISAKPPGKHMRSIQLLSGGEKCLTAMALLFAIFEVKPAPFCILDEIDAPLDDSNVDRFVRMVKEFTEKSQFIIITHNKRTMAIADILLGVSMQERGVSTILSIEFSNHEAESSISK